MAVEITCHTLTHHSNPTQPIKPYQQHYRALPALVTSTFVQCINMPIIRATITLQNPA